MTNIPVKYVVVIICGQIFAYYLSAAKYVRARLQEGVAICIQDLPGGSTWECELKLRLKDGDNDDNDANGDNWPLDINAHHLHFQGCG